MGLIDQNGCRDVQDNSTASTHIRGKPMADTRGSPRTSQGNELKTASNLRKYLRTITGAYKVISIEVLKIKIALSLLNPYI